MNFPRKQTFIIAELQRAPSQNVNRGLRVAKRYIFHTKAPNFGIFGGHCNGKCWYVYVMVFLVILRPFGILIGHLVSAIEFIRLCSILSRDGRFGTTATQV
jgi:hypothetical protein